MFTVFNKVDEVWEAQLRDIENAKHTVLFEQYIVENLDEGQIGRRFIDALVKKQNEGVTVKCIFDTQGAFEVYKNSAVNKLLTESGVKVLYYKTLGLSHSITPGRLILRDHRKLLLIDNEISWVGGVVVGERFRNWDDLMVRFTYTAIAKVLVHEFEIQFLRLQDRVNLIAPLKTIDSEYHISGNAPGIGNRFCYEEMCHALMRAQKSVVLVTPYFVPPFKLERVIKRKLADGLSITLLTPRHTDQHLVDLARESYMERLLKRGLTIKYSKKMVHAKIMIVDDAWMTFGSTNLDAVSLIFNHELNLTTSHVALIEAVSTVIKEWMEGIEDLTFANCEYQNQSFLGRLVGKYIRFIA